MKKEKNKPRIYDNSEADERRYLQNLKADQSMLKAFFNSIPQCYWMETKVEAGSSHPE